MKVNRTAMCLARWVLLAACSLGGQLFAQSSDATKAADVLIKNAVVMTVTHGNIKNGSIYIKDGKIAAVGRRSTRPPGPR